MRALARCLHRWLGLFAALVLFVSGATGALLVVAGPIDRALNAHWYASGLAERDVWPAATFDAVARSVRAEFPQARLVYRFPRAADDSFQVHVRGDWHGEVFFDATGIERGRRGERDGFFPLLFELHSSLLAQGTGKAVLFGAACAYVVMLVAGLVAWWPRRLRNALRLEFRRGSRRAVFDTHRVGGVLLGLVVLVSVASGAYMAYRPLSTWIAWLAGSATQPPPSVSRVPFAPATALALSVVVEAADEALPGGRVSIVDWPADARQPLRVRKQLPDEVHPNGLSSVWLHPATGAVLRVTPWRDADTAVRGFEVMYPLHIGELGGTAHKLLVGCMGLALAFFAASGPWLWLSRRNAARRAAASSRAAATRVSIRRRS